jgi:sterol desaturase/sphingolipid hydroxylase (fatty acid hydroxylase superfamily)
VKWIFIPRPVLYRLMPGAVILYFLVFRDLRYGLTASIGGIAILFVYEWTHFLIHSRYKPKTRVYRYIWRAHRLHHYKNENYWYGVTMHLADHVLGTFPDKAEVETSETCRTLGEETPATSAGVT